MSCDYRRTFLYELLSISFANTTKIVIVIIKVIRIRIIRITVSAIANKQYEDLLSSSSSCCSKVICIRVDQLTIFPMGLITYNILALLATA